MSEEYWISSSGIYSNVPSIYVSNENKELHTAKIFDKLNINWKFLNDKNTDFFDLYGDGSIKIIFTPGHSPGHQSILIKLPKSGNILLTIDAAYTVDHWENKCLPGLVTSSSQAAESVKKLRKIAKENNALVVTGHDPDAWTTFKKAPMFYYD